MSGFESAIRDLAKRRLQGTRISSLGEQSYDGFVRVGVKIDKTVINAMFTEINTEILKKKYDILKRFAHFLVWLSPVYTGYYVNNWQANSKWHQASTQVSSEPNAVGPYISSGHLRRQRKLSDSEGSTVKAASEDRMVAALQASFLAYEGDTDDLKSTWAFYNPTPYATAVNSKHGVIDGAIAAVGDS